MTSVCCLEKVLVNPHLVILLTTSQPDGEGESWETEKLRHVIFKFHASYRYHLENLDFVEMYRYMSCIMVEMDHSF